MFRVAQGKIHVRVRVRDSVRDLFAATDSAGCSRCETRAYQPYSREGHSLCHLGIAAGFFASWSDALKLISRASRCGHA